MAFILSALGKVNCRKKNTMNNYLTSQYKRENKVITIYYHHHQQQQHKLYLHDYNYVATVLQKL